MAVRSVKHHVINNMHLRIATKKPDLFESGYILFCDPAGARTQDPNIKSVVLYLLSYWVNISLALAIKIGLQKYYIFDKWPNFFWKIVLLDSLTLDCMNVVL